MGQRRVNIKITLSAELIPDNIIMSLTLIAGLWLADDAI